MVFALVCLVFMLTCSSFRYSPLLCRTCTSYPRRICLTCIIVSRRVIKRSHNSRSNMQPSETPSLFISPSSLPHPRPRAWSPSSFKLDPHLNSFDTMNNSSKSSLSVVSSNLEDPTSTINDHPSTSSSRKTAGTESRAWLKF